MPVTRNSEHPRLLMVTPSYKPSNENRPWKLSVTIAADVEPSFIVYQLLAKEEVAKLIKKAALELAPEYSAMGYMARNDRSKTAPSIHFTIFPTGAFPPIDTLVRSGKVCPSVGGKQVCIRSTMIE
jgi:hypothetical protein